MDPPGLLNDRQIRMLAHAGMIDPFEDTLISAADGQPVISYGLSSFGYDLRCADEWEIFTPPAPDASLIADPKAFSPALVTRTVSPDILIPPNGFVLARSVETITVPDDVLVIAVGKSTYARIGVIANVTPLEPGWSGHVTLEFSNTTPVPARMYAHEGCVQLLFFQGREPATTYASRNGKYQHQRGVTHAR